MRADGTIYPRLNASKISDTERPSTRSRSRRKSFGMINNRYVAGEVIEPYKMRSKRHCWAVDLNYRSQDHQHLITTEMKLFTISALTSLAVPSFTVVAEPNVAALRTLMTDSRFVGLVA